eukprot:Nk52_evm6s1569 gene=Nk52_evmTU6s1569
MSSDASAVKAGLKAAKENLGAKEYKKAIKACKGVLSIDKDNVNAFVFVGVATEGLGNFGQARQAYMKAIEIDPKNQLGYMGLLALIEKHPEVCQDGGNEGKRKIVGAYQGLLKLLQGGDVEKKAKYDGLLGKLVGFVEQEVTDIEVIWSLLWEIEESSTGTVLIGGMEKGKYSVRYREGLVALIEVYSKRLRDLDKDAEKIDEAIVLCANSMKLCKGITERCTVERQVTYPFGVIGDNASPKILTYEQIDLDKFKDAEMVGALRNVLWSSVDCLLGYRNELLVAECDLLDRIKCIHETVEKCLQLILGFDPRNSRAFQRMLDLLCAGSSVAYKNHKERGASLELKREKLYLILKQTDKVFPKIDGLDYRELSKVISTLLVCEPKSKMFSKWLAEELQPSMGALKRSLQFQYPCASIGAAVGHIFGMIGDNLSSLSLCVNTLTQINKRIADIFDSCEVSQKAKETLPTFDDGNFQYLVNRSKWLKTLQESCLDNLKSFVSFSFAPLSENEESNVQIVDDSDLINLCMKSMFWEQIHPCYLSISLPVFSRLTVDILMRICVCAIEKRWFEVALKSGTYAALKAQDPDTFCGSFLLVCKVLIIKHCHLECISVLDDFFNNFIWSSLESEEGKALQAISLFLYGVALHGLKSYEKSTEKLYLALLLFEELYQSPSTAEKFKLSLSYCYYFLARCYIGTCDDMDTGFLGECPVNLKPSRNGFCLERGLFCIMKACNLFSSNAYFIYILGRIYFLHFSLLRQGAKGDSTTLKKSFSISMRSFFKALKLFESGFNERTEVIMMAEANPLVALVSSGIFICEPHAAFPLGSTFCLGMQEPCEFESLAKEIHQLCVGNSELGSSYIFPLNQMVVKVASPRHAPWAFFGMGLHHQRKGNYVEAESFLQRCSRCDSDNVYVWIALGEIYESLGKFVACTKAFAKAFSLASKCDKKVVLELEILEGLRTFKSERDKVDIVLYCLQKIGGAFKKLGNLEQAGHVFLIGDQCYKMCRESIGDRHSKESGNVALCGGPSWSMLIYKGLAEISFIRAKSCFASGNCEKSWNLVQKSVSYACKGAMALTSNIGCSIANDDIAFVIPCVDCLKLIADILTFSRNVACTAAKDLTNVEALCETVTSIGVDNVAALDIKDIHRLFLGLGCNCLMSGITFVSSHEHRTKGSARSHFDGLKSTLYHSLCITYFYQGKLLKAIDAVRTAVEYNSHSGEGFISNDSLCRTYGFLLQRLANDVRVSGKRGTYSNSYSELLEVAIHFSVLSLCMNDRSAKNWTSLGVILLRQALHLGRHGLKLVHQAHACFSNAQRHEPLYSRAWSGQALVAILLHGTIPGVNESNDEEACKSYKEVLGLFEQALQLDWTYINNSKSSGSGTMSCPGLTEIGYSWYSLVLSFMNPKRKSAHDKHVSIDHDIQNGYFVLQVFLNQMEGSDANIKQANVAMMQSLMGIFHELVGLHKRAEWLYASAAEAVTLSYGDERKLKMCVRNRLRICTLLKKKLEFVDEKLSTICSTDFQCLLLMGRNAFHQEDYETSFTYFDRALELAKVDTPDNAYILGDILSSMALVAFASGNYPQAEEILIGCSETLPSYTKSLLLLSAMGLYLHNTDITAAALGELKERFGSCKVPEDEFFSVSWETLFAGFADLQGDYALCNRQLAKLNHEFPMRRDIWALRTLFTAKRLRSAVDLALISSKWTMNMCSVTSPSGDVIGHINFSWICCLNARVLSAFGGYSFADDDTARRAHEEQILSRAQACVRVNPLNLDGWLALCMCLLAKVCKAGNCKVDLIMTIECGLDKVEWLSEDLEESTKDVVRKWYSVARAFCKCVHGSIADQELPCEILQRLGKLEVMPDYAGVMSNARIHLLRSWCALQVNDTASVTMCLRELFQLLDVALNQRILTPGEELHIVSYAALVMCSSGQTSAALQCVNEANTRCVESKIPDRPVHDQCHWMLAQLAFHLIKSNDNDLARTTLEPLLNSENEHVKALSLFLNGYQFYVLNEYKNAKRFFNLSLKEMVGLQESPIAACGGLVGIACFFLCISMLKSFMARKDLKDK